MARISFSVTIACLLAVGDADPNQTQTGGVSTPAPAANGIPGAARYRVNSGPRPADPWQLYAESRSLAKANGIADECASRGYLAEVVDNSTPAPQFYPRGCRDQCLGLLSDLEFRGRLQPVCRAGGLVRYGWYGGWNPGYRHRSIPITGGTGVATGTAGGGPGP